MQRIIIRDFGPIKNCELELAQFIVLTGAQAAGKSTIAKAVYYFSLAKEVCFSLITGSRIRLAETLKSNLRGEYLLQTFYDLFGGTIAGSYDCWSVSTPTKRRFESTEKRIRCLELN